MKILTVHSWYSKNEKHRSAVDGWRCARPLEQLAKNMPDWTIDHQPTFIKGVEKYKDAKEFTPQEMEKAYKIICKYDVVFSSYHADPTAYSMLKVAAKNAGVKFIMDVDDDMFSVNPDNPFWIKMDDEKCYWMQCMIRDNEYISTTTDKLAKVFRDRREHPPETVFVNPNYIPDIYKHPKFDNGDDIVIGYFGGSSHYKDIHDTGVIEAVERIMHEHRNVRFKAVGMVVDKYLPGARYEFVEGKRGDGWVKEIYPDLKMDISLGPLDNNIFNNGKSNIKWQESTRAGACFVASNFGPYDSLKPDTAVLVPQNTPDDWYNAIKPLVEDKKLIKQYVKNAQEELNNWRLESNWQQYKKMFESVVK